MVLVPAGSQTTSSTVMSSAPARFILSHLNSQTTIEDANIDPILLAISAAHPSTVTTTSMPTQHVGFAPQMPPLNPYHYRMSPAPQYSAYQQHSLWPSYHPPSNYVDWRAAGPMNYGASPFPAVQTNCASQSTHRQAANAQTVRPIDLQARAGPSTTVWPPDPPILSPKKPRMRNEDNDVEESYLASVPLRRSARLRGLSPEPTIVRQASTPEIACMRRILIASSQSHKRSPSTRSTPRRAVKSRKTNSWPCFFRDCQDVLGDTRARLRHMDIHFPARYACSMTSKCDFTNTREDQIKIHARRCAGSSKIFTILDSTPHWLQKKHAHELRRPRSSDPIWRKDAPEWFEDLPIEWE